jgi:hypothetical protein
VGRDRDRK